MQTRRSVSPRGRRLTRHSKHEPLKTRATQNTSPTHTVITVWCIIWNYCRSHAVSDHMKSHLIVFKQAELMTNVETTQVTSIFPSIHQAVCDPHLSLDTVEAILWEDPSCLNSANPQNGFTPLHAAARRAHSGLIQLLIKSGADLEAQWRNGETAFLMACKVKFRL